MAVTDLVLDAARLVPAWAEANALAAGADDISVRRAYRQHPLPKRSATARSSPHRRRVRARIIGNNDAARECSRAASRRCRRRISSCRCLFGSERYGLATEDLNHLQCTRAHSAQPRVLLAESGHVVQLLAYEFSVSRGSRNRAPN